MNTGVSRAKEEKKIAGFSGEITLDFVNIWCILYVRMPKEWQEREANDAAVTITDRRGEHVPT